MHKFINHSARQQPHRRPWTAQDTILHHGSDVKLDGDAMSRYRSATPVPLPSAPMAKAMLNAAQRSAASLPSGKPIGQQDAPASDASARPSDCQPAAIQVFQLLHSRCQLF